jgi:hypothetical protein
MTTPRLATICMLTYGDWLEYYHRCLGSLLTHTPADAIELRLGFNEAPTSFHHALGSLNPDGGTPSWAPLPRGVERFEWVTAQGTPMAAWNSPKNLYKEPMARWMLHDMPLETEYAIWFDDDSYVDPGWWQALLPLLQKGIDYIGQPWWVFYQPGQAEMIQAQPWYRGLAFEQRQDKPGVQFMTGGFLAVRSARLREVDFPDTLLRWKGRGLQQYGGDTLLGEIARQQGWSRQAHDACVHVNVDMQGKHPAPRRGGIGRQFGSDVDMVIR